MKKSYLILFFLATFFSVKNVHAQASVTSSGISIQGIARDENNSALTNIDQLGLTFKIYYLDGSNNEVQILSQTQNVRTDNFGVFSYVLPIENTHFIMISNTPAYLKVTQGSVVFSNEKLQAVPYAIHAQNGVPTGTIMAYIGATAPTGWLLCDGSAIADNAATARLRELLGATTTPNLNARYLRGTGDVSGKIAIALKGTQDDTFKPHNHGVGSLVTNETGSHNHTKENDWNRVMRANGQYTMSSTDGAAANTEPNLNDAKVMADAGAHTHTITGNTADAGNATVNETRVFSYGVTWIIKI
jgi:microcystin-dependent protein